MNKKFLKILMVALLVTTTAVLFSGVSKVYAVDTTGCEAVGGTWVENGNDATCSFPPDHFWSTNCPEGYGAVDHWLWIENASLWEFNNRECALPLDFLNSVSLDVNYGSPVDVWNGNCGAYISNPPLSGSVTLNKVYQPVSPNINRVCEIKYYDFLGKQLDKFGSPAWVYYNLNGITAKLWNDGNLNMYIFQSGSWQTCSNPLFVDAGEFGRIACYANNPVRFGIGTATFRRDDIIPGANPFQ